MVAISVQAKQAAAIDELIGLAQRRIRVFDQDLSHTGWNLAARADRLAQFLREAGGRRLDIIVHDTHYLESACPRLLGLLRTYSFAITIYRTGTEAKLATDPLVVVDDRHYLHRFHFEQSRAAMGVNQPVSLVSDARRLACQSAIRAYSSCEFSAAAARGVIAAERAIAAVSATIAAAARRSPMKDCERISLL